MIMFVFSCYFLTQKIHDVGFTFWVLGFSTALKSVDRSGVYGYLGIFLYSISAYSLHVHESKP